MTAKLADALKGGFDEIALAPFRDGRFEVIADGKTVYSKLATGQFPDEETLVKQMKKTLTS